MWLGWLWSSDGLGLNWCDLHITKPTQGPVLDLPMGLELYNYASVRKPRLAVHRLLTSSWPTSQGLACLWAYGPGGCGGNMASCQRQSPQTGPYFVTWAVADGPQTPTGITSSAPHYESCATKEIPTCPSLMGSQAVTSQTHSEVYRATGTERGPRHHDRGHIPTAN